MQNLFKISHNNFAQEKQQIFFAQTIDCVTTIPSIHPSVHPSGGNQVLQALVVERNQRSPCKWLTSLYMVVPTIDPHHYGCSQHWFASLWLFSPLIHISLRLLFPTLIHIIMVVVPTIDPHPYSCCSHHWSTSIQLLFPPLIHITTVVPTIDPHHYGCSHHRSTSLRLFPPSIHIITVVVPTIDSHYKWNWSNHKWNRHTDRSTGGHKV